MTADGWDARQLTESPGYDGRNLEQHTTGHWGHVQPALSADGRSQIAYRFQGSESFEAGQNDNLALAAQLRHVPLGALIHRAL